MSLKLNISSTTIPVFVAGSPTSTMQLCRILKPDTHGIRCHASPARHGDCTGKLGVHPCCSVAYNHTTTSSRSICITSGPSTAMASVEWVVHDSMCYTIHGRVWLLLGLSRPPEASTSPFPSFTRSKHEYQYLLWMLPLLVGGKIKMLGVVKGWCRASATLLHTSTSHAEHVLELASHAWITVIFRHVRDNIIPTRSFEYVLHVAVHQDLFPWRPNGIRGYN
jgi:hypothetical protein